MPEAETQRLDQDSRVPSGHTVQSRTEMHGSCPHGDTTQGSWGFKTKSITSSSLKRCALLLLSYTEQKEAIPGLLPGPFRQPGTPFPSPLAPEPGS